MNLRKVLVAIVVLQFVFCLPALADNVGKKKKELTGLQGRIKQLAHSINGLKVQKHGLLVELKKLDRQYGESTAQLRRVEKQLKKLSAKVTSSRRKIALKRKEIDSQKHVLEQLMRAAYGMGKHEKLKLMLNQQEPSLSGRVMVYYDYFNKARLEKVQKISADLLLVDALERQQEKEMQVLDRELEQKKKTQQVLSETQAKKKQVLAKIDKRFASESQQLSRSKQSEKKLKKLIFSLQQIMDDFPIEEGVKPFAKLKGKLPWPVKGKLVRRFGERRTDSKWDGVLIKAKEGREIRAITRGRVVYADWLRGYGLLTIIDHGKGYMSLYAFTQSLYKTVGDWVDPGTVIASVGLSGGQAEAGLYFGIRKKGKPVNPVKWCRKIRHGNI